eukprot:5406430-Alexandrium_andersonii.AAC.1
MALALPEWPWMWLSGGGGASPAYVRRGLLSLKTTLLRRWKDIGSGARRLPAKRRTGAWPGTCGTSSTMARTGYGAPSVASRVVPYCSSLQVLRVRTSRSLVAPRGLW